MDWNSIEQLEAWANMVIGLSDSDTLIGAAYSMLETCLKLKSYYIEEKKKNPQTKFYTEKDIDEMLLEQGKRKNSLSWF